ncbi:MAG TPA: CoA transferase [Burkholderiales bacterium]|nr:CoA transferase [Burkholderiales bacterium]
MQQSTGNGGKLPLSDLTVIDLTLARAGPTCVRHLADWGANIIRVEPPVPAGEDVVGRRHGTDFQNLHRNKRAIRLDLKSEAGHKAFEKLVQRADVVVENMRPQVKHRLKVAYDDVKKINPRIVYGSISGFGQDGPYSTKGGVDQIAQGMGGLMSITGIPGTGPVRVGIPVNDLVAGSLLAYGVMTALFERERTGVGRWVHTSLLETQIFLLDFQASRYLMKGEVAKQTGNDHPTMTPSGVFKTSDGYINLAASSGRLFERLCDVCEKPEWKTHPQFGKLVERTANRPAFNAALEDVLKEKPTAYWVEKFDEAGIPAGPINTIDKVFADPQVQHLGIAAPLVSPIYGETKIVASPINFPGTKKEIRSPTPEAGEHTDEVLKWLGYTANDIEQMRASGTI